MADPLALAPSDDPRDFERATDFGRAYGQPSEGLAFDVIARDARLTERVMGLGAAWRERAADASGWDSPFLRDPMTGQRRTREVDADYANETYGLEGYLKFDRPVYEADAAFRLKMAREAQFRDEVLSRSDIGPLSALGAGIWGTITDPVGLPLIFAPELMGLGKVAQGGWSALRGGAAAIKAGRLANAGRFALEGAAEGLVGGALYEGFNYTVRNELGEDYSFGDATRNIILGAVLGAGFGGALGAALPPGWVGGARHAAADGAVEGAAADFGAAAPEAPVTLPRQVADLSEDARAGAVMTAIEATIEDAPVNVAALVERERAANLSLLDETRVRGPDDAPAAPELDGRRLEADLAVTTRGTEIPVRYALVELADLTTSHDGDLIANPDFPPELQPRDRSRAGSADRNRRLEGELNPKRLMRDSGAETGAPIVSADGVVESGNGRTIALRRSADGDGEAWSRYQAELKAQGFDTEGMDQPVLVRVRESALTGEERAALVAEMNADVTERLGPLEQAMVDADLVDVAMLAVLQGDDPFAAGNRPFQRAFLERVAGDQMNVMVGEGGELTAAGRTRIMAALVAGAYRDARLTEALFESGENNIRAIGGALAQAAPAWARMRAAVAAGTTAPDLDLTPNLRSAVDLIRHARDSGRDLAELVALKGDMEDMFSGEVLAPETEAFLQLFFRRNKDGTPNFKQQRGGQRIGEGLIAFARRAEDHTPEGGLFGDTPDGNARIILADVLDWVGRQTEEQSGDLLARLRAEPDAAGSDGLGGPPRAAADAGGDVRGPGLLGDGPDGSGGRPAGGDAADGGGDAGRDAGAGGEGLAAEPGPGDLWQASPDELEALLASKLSSDGDKLVKALGEDGAKEFKRLERARNNTYDTARADKAAKEFDAKFGELTPEQERLIYGVGESDASVDDIKTVLEAHGDVASADPDDWVEYMAAVAARNLTPEDITAVRGGKGSSRAQAAFVRMQLAAAEMGSRGVDPNALSNRMVAALVNVAGWPVDHAEEIIGSFVEGLTANAARRDPVASAPLRLAAPQAAVASPYGTVEHWTKFARSYTNGATPERYRGLYKVDPPAKAERDAVAALLADEQAADAAKMEAARPKGAAALIAADPELKALAEQTEAFIQAEGLTVETAPASNPDTMAEAIRAAAFCLVENGGLG